jgi:hypothetical protein
MANNYTLFAEYIPMPEDACNWALKLNETLNHIFDQTFNPNTTQTEIFKIAEKIFGEEDSPSNCEWTNNGNLLIITSEEDGNISVVATILQETLKKFNLKGACYIEFAHTCDKPRTGEFGGGAVVITKDKQHWLNTSYWIEEKLLEIIGPNESAEAYQLHK